MSLVVEDGSGISNAESYRSVADTSTYFANLGNTTWGAASLPQQEQALRAGTAYIEAAYGQRWLGRRASFAQALGFPRFGVLDYDGYCIASNVIPVCLLNACSEAALRALTDGDMLPDISQPGALKSETVKVGSIEIADTWMGGQGQIKFYRKIDLLLQPLIVSAGMALRS